MGRENENDIEMELLAARLQEADRHIQHQDAIIHRRNVTIEMMKQEIDHLKKDEGSTKNDGNIMHHGRVVAYASNA